MPCVASRIFWVPDSQADSTRFPQAGSCHVFCCGKSQDFSYVLRKHQLSGGCWLLLNHQIVSNCDVWSPKSGKWCLDKVREPWDPAQIHSWSLVALVVRSMQSMQVKVSELLQTMYHAIPYHAIPCHFFHFWISLVLQLDYFCQSGRLSADCRHCCSLQLQEHPLSGVDRGGPVLGHYGIWVSKLISTLWWTNIAMENHHFSWENPLFLWPFSIAMLVHQRVSLLHIKIVGISMDLHPTMGQSFGPSVHPGDLGSFHHIHLGLKTPSGNGLV